MGVEIAYVLPRDPVVQEAENRHTTVVEAFPDSEMSRLYVGLAEKIADE